MNDPRYDPVTRPDAAALFGAYADKGYKVVYVTARDETGHLRDGRSWREATASWLDGHGFPRSEGDLILKNGGIYENEALIGFKAVALQDLTARGDVFDWGYGNRWTDMHAYTNGGVPQSHLFLVGTQSEGDETPMNVTRIPDSDAFTAHLAAQLPLMEDVH